MAQAKHYVHAYCKYTLPSLRNDIVVALGLASQECITKHFMKVYNYMSAYLQEIPADSELEDAVEQYKKTKITHKLNNNSNSKCLSEHGVFLTDW